MSNETRSTRKLRLDTEALHVESFDVAPIAGRSGTVQGYATEQHNTNCCGVEPPPPSIATCDMACGTRGLNCGVSHLCTAVASCFGCTNEH